MRDKLLMIFMSLLTLGVALFAIDAYRDKSELEEKLATYQSEEQLKKMLKSLQRLYLKVEWLNT